MRLVGFILIVIGGHVLAKLASIMLFRKSKRLRKVRYRVGYARTNVTGSRTSFVKASVRSSIH